MTDAGELLLRGRRKDLALLAFLARRSPRPAQRAELASLFWETSPDERARLSLRQSLFRLRQELPNALEIDGDTVRLNANAIVVDATRFEQDVIGGRNASAVSAWDGEFLAGSDDVAGQQWTAWLEGERAGLRRLLARAFDALVTEASARGSWADAVAYAQRWSHAIPDDVTAHRRLVEALSLAGRGAEAAALHAAFVARTTADGEALPPEVAQLAGRVERAARAVPPSPGSAGLFSPDMVGRGDAFAELTLAWREGRAGRPSLVVIEGAAGMGKTRLVTELTRVVARASTPAVRLHARAYAHETPDDLALARELFAPLVDAPGLLATPAEALAALTPLLPALRDRVPDLPTPAVDELSLVTALTRALAEVAHEQPVLLVVDDIGSADVASRRLLGGVLRRIGESAIQPEHPGLALLAIITARPGMLSRDELRDAPTTRWVRLRPLDVPATDALIASMLELSVDERASLAARVAAESGGNPLDVIEIVGALVDDGLLATDERGHWRLRFDPAADDAPLPHSAREALARRLERLDSCARELLEALVVSNEPFDASSAGILAGRHPTEIAAALEQLLLRRLVRRTARGERYELTSDIVAELVASRRRRVPAPDASVLPSSSATIVPGLTKARTRRRWHRAAVASAALGAAFLALFVGREQRKQTPRAPAIAIANVSLEIADSSTAWMADGVTRLIEARLSQTESVEPIPAARLHDAMRRAGLAVDSAESERGLSLARRLGATLLVVGRLRRADTTFLLDLHLTNLEDRAASRRIIVEGRDALALADAAAVQLWRGLAARNEGVRLAAVTTTSAEAYRQFMRANAAQSSGRAAEQRSALDAAIALDSAFGSALLERVYLARHAFDTATERRLVAAFERHRARIPMRDRLEWDASVTALGGAPEAAELSLKELIRRYPRDPRAYYRLAELRASQGRWDEAERVMQNALALDSLAMEAGSGACVACRGYARLVEYRVMQGDRNGAIAAAERLVSLTPGDANAWVWRAFVEACYGQFDQAVSDMHRVLSLGGDDPWLHLLYGRILLMARRFDAVDSLVTAWRAAPSRVLSRNAADLEVLVTRERGPAQTALNLLDTALKREPNETTILLVRAHMLGRAGRYAEAERVFEAHAHEQRPDPMAKPADARAFAWEHALLADAIAGAADTTRLLALADSIERIGARSYYGRDWVLHHHVRGLVAMRARRYRDAIQEFEQARFGRPGWTRTVIELANAYLAVGQPLDAVRVLRSGYEGWPDAMARYATRADLDELMALAFARAGQRDSAEAYSARSPGALATTNNH